MVGGGGEVFMVDGFAEYRQGPVQVIHGVAMYQKNNDFPIMYF